MQVLITGAGGAVGCALAKTYAEAGDQVLGLYRSTPPNFEHKNLVAMPFSLADSFEQFDRVDLVIHAAAETHLNLKATAESYACSNIDGVLALAAYLRRTQPQLAVFLSTISVYGDIQTEVLDENQPYRGPNLYGVSKLFGEGIMQEVGTDVPTIALRLPGVVGGDLMTPWLGRALEKLKANEKVEFFNGSNPFNNLIDPDGLRDLINDVLSSGPEGFTLMNVGASAPMALSDVLKVMAEMLGSQSEIIEMDSDKTSFSIDIEPLRERFGHTPRTTKEIVGSYVNANT
ncbi:MAG: NAD(P)-dependent oxidoreductase [Magnetovibrio sp.]|nr:NAD(P)-dependent oxidoreductase [Magnetovibrio sp.]